MNAGVRRIKHIVCGFLVDPWRLAAHLWRLSNHECVAIYQVPCASLSPLAPVRPTEYPRLASHMLYFLFLDTDPRPIFCDRDLVRYIPAPDYVALPDDRTHQQRHKHSKESRHAKHPAHTNLRLPVEHEEGRGEAEAEAIGIQRDGGFDGIVHEAFDPVIVADRQGQ